MITFILSHVWCTHDKKHDDIILSFHDRYTLHIDIDMIKYTSNNKIFVVKEIHFFFLSYIIIFFTGKYNIITK